MHVYLSYHFCVEHFLARVFYLLQHRLKRHRSFDVDALLLEVDRVRRDAWCKCCRSPYEIRYVPSSLPRTRSIAREQAPHVILTSK